MRDKVIGFLREVYGEFKRVSWPSRVEVIGLTTLVILIVVVLSVYIGLWDFIFQRIIAFLLRR
jgi:preprotein translocase subunit SecE